jgi:primosomal protein N' (replication factor Y) (superfamily II helicase)
VIIQTTNTGHPVLQYVKHHDYKEMYVDEIEKRKQFFYPPFSRVIHLIFKHKLKEVVERAAHQIADALKNKYDNYIVGPAEPIINRIRNQYLMELLLKLPRDSKTIIQCKKDVMDQITVLHMNKSYRAVTIIPDVDPV